MDFPLSGLYTCSLLAIQAELPRPAKALGYGAGYGTTTDVHTNSETAAVVQQNTEKSMGTDSDAASETTLAPHYYNYNSQELNVQGPKPTQLQLELPPKPFAQGRPLPHRF
ncbi:hypothetical protein B0H13DRAFT_2355585 [Mycena leptocephala]|nr:hypothetical protein B0H13DRAFT_2355585 [Mycena leptocephala]